MAKYLVAYYGDNPYDHDTNACEWGRTPITPEDEKSFVEKYISQMTELYNRKRIVWYHIMMLTFDANGSSSVTVDAKYRPLRHKIILNEAAKEDMKKAKVRVKMDMFNAYANVVNGGAIPLDAWQPVVAAEAFP
jgi:hypothetical protein